MRLSNRKAKALLEFICKKALRACSCNVKFMPFHEDFKSNMLENVLCRIIFDIEWLDGKGCYRALMESQELSSDMDYARFYRQNSWSSILRHIERKARKGTG